MQTAERIPTEKLQTVAEEIVRKAEGNLNALPDAIVSLVDDLQRTKERIEQKGELSVSPTTLHASFASVEQLYRKTWEQQKFVKALRPNGTFDGGYSR